MQLRELCFWAIMVLIMPRMAYAEYRTVSPAAGVKGGTNWVKWYRPGPANTRFSLAYLPSFSAGIYGLIDWRIAPRLNIGIQPELTFVRRGTDTDFDGEEANKFMMEYIEIPILARVAFQISERVHPFVMFGSRLGVLRRVIFEEPSGDTGELSGYASADFGVSISAGTELSVSKRFDITIKGRYDVGFVDLAPDNEDSDIRNQGLSLLLGVNWNVLGGEQ